MTRCRRCLIAFPTNLNLKDIAEGAAPRSWIQLARTGRFVSKRYGKFSITRDDSSQMLHNFDERHAEGADRVAHRLRPLVDGPKRPGDGTAAGWMKKLELREDGDELWAEVEWTPTARTAMQEREYRFISPSFVKDHTHKDGPKIGTTLLAAAITNHPFLEGMRAVTLNAEQLAMTSRRGREAGHRARRHVALGSRPARQHRAGHERTPEAGYDVHHQRSARRRG